VRFELTVPEGTTVFETAAFDHSATSPVKDAWGLRCHFVRPFEGLNRSGLSTAVYRLSFRISDFFALTLRKNFHFFREFRPVQTAHRLRATIPHNPSTMANGIEPISTAYVLAPKHEIANTSRHAFARLSSRYERNIIVTQVKPNASVALNLFSQKEIDL
jgi:hypothetical protein